MKMGGKTVSICLAMFIHAASSIIATDSSSSTISPSKSIIEASNSISNLAINLSINSSAISNPSSTTSGPAVSPSVTASTFGFLSPKPSSNYEVTENVIDVPDNRPLAPIVPNFSLSKPLNVANANANINNAHKNDTGDENNQPKRTSFTYVHFTKDPEDTKVGGVKQLFKGIKDYVYNLKKGVVDGLHSFFHRDEQNKDKGGSFYDKFYKSNGNSDKDDNINFHHKFYRNFHSDESFDDYDYEHEDKDLDD